MKLYQVQAKHFCAGFETNQAGIIVVAAPILRRNMGKHIDWFLKFAKTRDWKVLQVAEDLHLKWGSRNPGAK